MIAWICGVIRMLVVAGLFFGYFAGVASVQSLSGATCTPVMKLSRLAGVAEASGVAVSRRTPGIIWSHNDSGPPVLFAFDAKGAARGRVVVSGADVADWEDLAAGPCAQGTCLYIADIGDNNRGRRQLTIYRVPEPRPEDKTTAPAEPITLTYPDGPHDAEALFVADAQQLFIVSKENADTTALYRALLGGNGARLELVAKLPVARITGGAASPDGHWVALRTNEELLLYRMADLTGGKRTEPRRFELVSVGEPQGEGVAIGADGLIHLVGEGGGGSGTLATIKCPLR